MVRGLKYFECSKCGLHFIGPDIEYNCTPLSTPLPCPKCGALSYSGRTPERLKENLERQEQE